MKLLLDKSYLSCPQKIICLLSIVATTSLKTVNRLLSKLKKIVFCGNYKRTQQGVHNILLFYLYNRYMVCANNKYTYSNIHILFMSLLYYFHKINIIS